MTIDILGAAETVQHAYLQERGTSSEVAAHLHKQAARRQAKIMAELYSRRDQLAAETPEEMSRWSHQLLDRWCRLGMDVRRVRRHEPGLHDAAKALEAELRARLELPPNDSQEN